MLLMPPRELGCPQNVEQEQSRVALTVCQPSPRTAVQRGESGQHALFTNRKRAQDRAGPSLRGAGGCGSGPVMVMGRCL